MTLDQAQAKYKLQYYLHVVWKFFFFLNTKFIHSAQVKTSFKYLNNT